MAEDAELKAMGAIKAALEPLDPETRHHVLRWAVERFNVPIEVVGGSGEFRGEVGSDREGGGKNGRGETPPLSVFINEHPKKTQGEGAAVLAVWDHLKNGTEEFTPDSIEVLWKKSGWKKAGNLNQAVIDAAKKGWLDKKERGKYEVTSYGVNHVLTKIVPADKKG